MANQEEDEGNSSTKRSGFNEETTGVFHVIPTKDCCCFVLMISMTIFWNIFLIFSYISYILS